MDRLTAFARFRRRLHDVLPEATTAAYDRRGYATSVALLTPAPPLAFAKQLDDLDSVVYAAQAASGSTGPLIIVGHSLGATVTMGYAARQSTPESALAAGNTGLVGIICGEPPLPWLPWWPSRAGGSTLAAAQEGGPTAAAESFMRRIVSDRVWERLPEDTKAARLAEGPALISDLTSLRTGGAPFLLTDVRVPTMFFRGTRSALHAKRGAEFAAATVPRARLQVLDGASHAVHSERPNDHVGAVLALLQQHV
jgi:pimeloyl-ACP methyl ester carboxylesterase